MKVVAANNRRSHAAQSRRVRRVAPDKPALRETAPHFPPTRAFQRDAKRIFAVKIVRRAASALVMSPTTREIPRTGTVTTHPTADLRFADSGFNPGFDNVRSSVKVARMPRRARSLARERDRIARAIGLIVM